MTSLFAARRRAEDFASALDAAEAGRPVPSGTEPGLTPLLEVAAALRGQADVAPRPEFAGDLRARLMAEAASVLTPDAPVLTLPPRTRGKRERRLVAAASAVVLIGGTASMAAAAQHALPGQALYPVKRGIEQVQAGLSTSPTGKGRDLLNQADDRLIEVRGLLADGSVDTLAQVPPTIDTFTAQAQQGADLLLSSFAETRDPATVLAVRTFAADGLRTLEQLAAATPPDAQDELGAAAVALRDIDRRAASLCPSCADGRPPLVVPRMLLVQADAARALRQVPAGGGLDNSHPVVVPRDAVGRLADAAGSAADQLTARPSAPTSSAPAPSSGDATGSTSGGLTGNLPSLPLPSVSESSTTSGSSGGGSLDGTVDGLTDGLQGTVETLLPDPGTDLLP